MEREGFSSKIGMVLAMAGSAVGLGNIWRFPYLVGEYGGASFIFVYVLAVLFLSIPILLSEFIIGRRARTNSKEAFVKLSGKKFWKITGIFIFTIPVIILSYYNVVGGWSVEYLIKSINLDFTAAGYSDAELKALFPAFISSTWKPIIVITIFILATGGIVALGIKGGIEACGKILMPVLFFIIIGIAIWVATLPGAGEGLRYLFRPDFSKITPECCLAAMGQAFFSLSIGCGAMITYGSYVGEEVDLFKSAIQVTLLDLMFALIASCAIMPAAFAYGLDPGQGPGLVFETLPLIFSKIPLGGLIAILFFGAILIAAITSSMSLFQVIVAWMVEDRGMKKSWSIFTTLLFMVATGTLCSLSFGCLSDVTICGKTIFDCFDFASANLLMPPGSILTLVFVGWTMTSADVFDELTNGGKLKTNRKIYPLVRFLIRYVAPIGTAVIFIAGFF